MFKKLSAVMSKSSATLPKAVPPVQPVERKPLAPLPPQQRNGNLSCDDSDSTSGDSSLEGNVELKVELPDGRNVSLSVERRMPMMDLLIQIATSYKLSPSNHQINVFNGQDSDFVTYKANTPIGSLNASKVQVVPRRSNLDAPSKKLSKRNQPFEQTFRLQVHLPRQQLLVIRASPHARLSEIFNTICQQRDLDPSRYALQHPTSPETQLDCTRSLAHYNLTEINVILKRSSLAVNSRTSTGKLSSDSVPDTEEKKRKRIFGFMFRKSKSSIGDSSSDEYSSRGGSPARSEPENKLVTPHITQQPLPSVPSRPAKRIAPMPPTKPSSVNERPPPPPPLHPKTKVTTATSDPQSHSRHSSDSSGYHESSVHGDYMECVEPEVPKVSTSLSNLTSTSSTSTTSIVSGIKKRRAPPPPAPLSLKTTTLKTVAVIESNPAQEFRLSTPPVEEEPPVISAEESSEMVSEVTSPAGEPERALEEQEKAMSDYPPDKHVGQISQMSDESITDERSPEPNPEPQIQDYRTQSFTGLTNTSQNTATTITTTITNAHPHEVEHNASLNLHFEISEISGDKYREENSGSCSRSDTHTTSDSAVADLDLDASGSSSWSPIPDVKPVGYTREMFMSAMIHESDIDEEKTVVSEKKTIADAQKPEVIHQNRNTCHELSPEEDLAYDDINDGNRGKYDWASLHPVITQNCQNKIHDDDNHDDWIKSSSEDEHEMVDHASSPTSTCSSDDLTASFEKVIAVAESAMQKEEEEMFLKHAQVDNRQDKTSDKNDDTHDRSQFIEKHTDKIEADNVLPKTTILVPKNRAPLMNFSISAYGARGEVDSPKSLSHSESFHEKSSNPDISGDKRPTLRSNSFYEKNSTDSVQFKLAPYKSTGKNSNDTSLDINETAPIKDKSVSMMNLSSDENFQLKRTISDQQISVCDGGPSPPVESAEYVRLQEEYLKLQQKLMQWQQQLLTNQTLLQQQKIVPENLFSLPREMFSPPEITTNLSKQNSMSATDLVKEKNTLSISKSQNDISAHEDVERVELKREPQKQKSEVELAPKPLPKPVPAQRQNATNPMKTYPQVSSKAQSLSAAPVVKVESMKNHFPRSVSVDGSFVDSRKNEEKTENIDKSSSLPSVKDRIGLLLGNKSSAVPSTVIQYTDPSKCSKPDILPRKEWNSSKQTNSGDKNVSAGKNFERGELARKPVKPVNFVLGNYKDSSQEKSDTNAKFRRQRISPSYLPEKEMNGEGLNHGESVKWNGNENAVPNQRKNRSSRPLVLTYFGEQVNGGDKEHEEESIAIRPTSSAASKVARNEVLSQPNIPIGLITDVKKRDAKTGKIGLESSQPSKPVKKRGKSVQNVTKYNTQPNTRDTLMNAIREFGGRNQLKKVSKSDTRWNSWHGEIA